MSDSDEQYYVTAAVNLVSQTCGTPAADIDVVSANFEWIKDGPPPEPGQMSTQTSHQRWTIILYCAGQDYQLVGEFQKVRFATAQQ